MNLDQWARRVDDVVLSRDPNLRTHVEADERALEALRACGVVRFGLGDPLWTGRGGSVGARVAEDDATLRAVFIPSDEGAIKEQTYVRSSEGANEAAAAIAAFLSGT